MDHKQNILIVHNYYQIPGGEDTVVANEAQMLRDHGHRVTLYTRDNSELKTMGKAGKLLLPFASIFNPRTYREVKKLIREEKIDIVHVHNTLHLISPAIYYAARSLGVPVVQTVHNFRLLCPGAVFYRDGHICEDCVTKGLKCAIIHRCYRGSLLQTLLCVINTRLHRLTGIYRKINYICLTEFNKEKLLMLKQVRAEQVFVKPNFVKESGLYIPGEEREKQFVFVGRLDKLKGIDFLLQAWERLETEAQSQSETRERSKTEFQKLSGMEKPKLIVCGTGPMEEWCRQFAADHQLNVEFKGFVANNQAKKIMAQSRAMILPTRWYEGFPMSIVEAFSVGTPVIVPDLGNAGSVVEEGVNGYKYRAEDMNSLVRCLKMCAGGAKPKSADSIDCQANPARMHGNINLLVLHSGDIYGYTFDQYMECYTEKANYRQLLDIYKQVR